MANCVPIRAGTERTGTREAPGSIISTEKKKASLSKLEFPDQLLLSSASMFPSLRGTCAAQLCLQGEFLGVSELWAPRCQIAHSLKDLTKLLSSRLQRPALKLTLFLPGLVAPCWPWEAPSTFLLGTLPSQVPFLRALFSGCSGAA